MMNALAARELNLRDTLLALISSPEEARISITGMIIFSILTTSQRPKTTTT